MNTRLCLKYLVHNCRGKSFWAYPLKNVEILKYYEKGPHTGDEIKW